MLIVTDLHLTDRADDSYRWDLFPWLERTLLPDEALLVLGDVTDAKDSHSSRLTNRVVDAFVGLQRKHKRRRIYIIKGNHDYVDADRPFFRFLNNVLHVSFITHPTTRKIEGHRCTFLPHTKTPEKDWATCPDLEQPPDVIFCHQAFDGAEAGNGYRLTTGVSRRYFTDRYGAGTPPVYSGDIHTPQKLGDVVYVGTPYPVAFGDDHKPRAIRLDKNLGMTSLRVPSIRRALLVMPADEVPLLNSCSITGFSKGDQAKVVIEMRREDFPMWDDYRKTVLAGLERQGVLVRSIEMREATAGSRQPAALQRSGVSSTRTAPQALRAFCKARQIDGDAAQVGLDLLNDTTE